MARASQFIEEFVARLDKESPEISTVFIVTHAATKIALGRALLNDGDAEIRTGVCSLDTYVRSAPAGGERGAASSWVAKAIGETHYLADGEEMHWDFSKYLALVIRMSMIRLRGNRHGRGPSC